MERLWTIGIVNYRSSVYLPWQLKILFEANPPRSFQLIIVDNSRPHEREELERLAAPYRARFGNIELIFHAPVEKSASGQHGEALELIRAKARTRYLLVQDPDFFWVQNRYLQTLGKTLRGGALAVGAPAPAKVGLGHPWYPSASGCAYRRKELAGVDFSALVTTETIRDSFSRWPQSDGFQFSFDVGWKIRKALSSKPFVSFEQRTSSDLNRAIGAHSFATISCEYLHGGKTIAFHLFRGSFTGLWTEAFADPEIEIPRQWLEVRNRYGEYFYNRFRRDLDKIPLTERFLRYARLASPTRIRTRTGICGIMALFREKSAAGRALASFARRAPFRKRRVEGPGTDR